MNQHGKCMTDADGKSPRTPSNNNVPLRRNGAAKSFPYAAATSHIFTWQVVQRRPWLLTAYTHAANTFTDDKFVCQLMAMFIHVQCARGLTGAITGAEKRPV